jgi:hypothetical protein
MPRVTPQPAVEDVPAIGRVGLYLGSCEATFLERYTGLFQLLLVKNGAQRALFNEPWSDTAKRPRAAASSASAA